MTVRIALARALIPVLGIVTLPRVFAQAADVPYVATPMNVVEAMLELGSVGPEDYLIDLGSGDGRIVITAVKKRGARGLGVELDGALVSEARREAQRQGIGGRAEFRAENLFVTDLKAATVLTSYLFPRINMQLRPVIFEQLKPGSRVVSHEFDFGNWKPDAQVTVKVPNKPYGPPQSDVFLWVVPAKAAGRWEWRFPEEPARAYSVTFEQTFQELRGTAAIADKPARLENAWLRGEEVRFTLVAELDGKPLRREFVGRVAGDTLVGKARAPNAESGIAWHATRVAPGKINID